MQLAETLDAASTARICADGCLVADVFAARTGIQPYLGREVDPTNANGLRDRASVNVYRPVEEVFSRDSLASYAAAPVTVDHPTVLVDASNWKTHGVGEINGDIARDGERVRVPVIVRDAGAVAKAQTTHKQLSMGYTCKLDFTPGTAPDGTAYDAVQREIRINHIALVPAARGGPELRIVDERPNQESPLPKIVLIDGLSVDVSNVDTAATTIATLIAARDAATKKVTDLEAAAVASAATVVAKDAEITKLTADLAAAKPTLQQLRDAGKQFAVIEGKAKAAGVTVTDGMDEAAIMKAVVDKAMGDKAKNYTADHIAIAFDALTKDVKPADPVADAFRGGIVSVGDAAQREQQAWTAGNDHNAWRTAGKAN